MGFNTRDAKRQVMSADVQRWCQAGSPDELRTLVISLRAGTDTIALQARLVELDVTVLSSGTDVIIATVRCDTVTTISLIDGIGRVDMPHSYQTKLVQNDPGKGSETTDDTCPDDS